MRTSQIGIALAGLMASVSAAAAAEAPSWATDYRAAREQVAKDQKPLAVIVAPGATSSEGLPLGEV